MFRRLAVLVVSILALLTFSAPAASAQPTTTIGQVPPGFPADLTQFVGGTKEFLAGPWFQGPCKDHGGDVGAYINRVMFQEPRLLYWTAPPAERIRFWMPDPFTVPDNVDVTKEPPDLPKTFPAVVAAKSAYLLLANYCADDLKAWTNPAANTWGFNWVSTPDGDSLEAMKKHRGADDTSIEKFSNACGERNSPYCQKAFFVDCARAGMNADKKAECVAWNVAVANLFIGLTQFIDDNTSWLQKVGQFLGIVGEAVWTGGKWVVDAHVGILVAAANIAMFIVNPADAIDNLANSLHRSAVDFSTKVLQGLSGVGHFDPSAPWFLRTYAASTGLGLVVMAFMAILMIARTASGGGGRTDLQESLFKHLPIGVFLAVFAPAIGAVLSQAVDALTRGIVAWSGGSLGGVLSKLGALAMVTAAHIPGGAFVGVLLFLFMVIGSFAVFVGLAIQSIALPISGVVAGLAWGMWVHPRWRRKALKVPFTYIGVLLSKPLLFFVLGVIFALIDGTLSEPAMRAGGIPLLTQIVLVIVGLLVAGFAPFSLLRYAPLLPTSADSHDSQSSPGFGTAAVVGAGIGAMETHTAKKAAPKDDRSQGTGNGAAAGNAHTIAQTYGQQKRTAPTSSGGGSQRPGARTGAAATAAGGKPGGGALAAGTGPAASAGAAAGATTGTTAGAASTGAKAGAVGGVWGVAAQVGVAGLNKARQAAHTRHLPEVDDDATKED